MQCKERVDLLEALKQSRLESQAGEGADNSASQSSNGKLSKGGSKTPKHSSDSEGAEAGWIGGGTIPAVNYPELSRLGPPLPHRPSMVSKNSSDRAVVGRNASSPSALPSSSTRPPSATGATLAPRPKKSSRSPSPEKGRSMLTTLRSGKSEKKTTLRSPPISGHTRPDHPVPSKAATLAWNSVGRGGRDRLGRSIGIEGSSSTNTLDPTRKGSFERPASANTDVHYDSTTRRLVNGQPKVESPLDLLTGKEDLFTLSGRSNSYPFPPTDPGQPGAVAGQMRKPSAVQDLIDLDFPHPLSDSEQNKARRKKSGPLIPPHVDSKFEPVSYPTYMREYPDTTAKKSNVESHTVLPIRRRSPAKGEARGDSKPSSKVTRKPLANSSSPRHRDRHMERDEARKAQRRESKKSKDEEDSIDDDADTSEDHIPKSKKKPVKKKEDPILAGPATPSSDEEDATAENAATNIWEAKVAYLMKNLPKGVDEGAAKQIFNEIVVQGDEVHWEDVSGLEVAKNALKEAVVYPFLRPDLFMGLREPARGMLLFGPPGTGKTMLARAVATESRSTFFSISASSLTSKYLGESEKLVRALFALAKALAPSIIFVDEIDSLLSSRSGSGEHEATRRIKTEFLIQWSDLQRAAAGREQTEKEKERGDASRVLVLAATNLPWAIDEAARRRFVRRQYIPLPEADTRAAQLRRLLGHQKHSLDERDIQKLVTLTDGSYPHISLTRRFANFCAGFSGSDITALAKDAAMGPLRSLGEALLHMSMDQIRPIQFKDFEASLINIRPSVSKQGLKEFEDWAKEFGERGG
jgi:SpoVK/Ycf46/Vps4 family AAA+-type ATPase